MCIRDRADAPRADGFKWGMTALPAVKAGGDSYSYTWFEQAWIPSGAEHVSYTHLRKNERKKRKRTKKRNSLLGIQMPKNFGQRDYL